MLEEKARYFFKQRKGGRVGVKTSPITNPITVWRYEPEVYARLSVTSMQETVREMVESAPHHKVPVILCREVSEHPYLVTYLESGEEFHFPAYGIDDLGLTPYDDSLYEWELYLLIRQVFQVIQHACEVRHRAACEDKLLSLPLVVEQNASTWQRFSRLLEKLS